MLSKDLISCKNHKDNNEMRKFLLMIFSACLLTQAHAFPCYITMMKDNCWTAYDVNVDLIDVATEQVIASMSIPKGKSWDRKEIVCQPKQVVKLKAKFSPDIWVKDKGREYVGKRFWSFPEQINQGDAAWNMVLCFSRDIQDVPLPPDVSGQCACDAKDIPPIAPR